MSGAADLAGYETNLLFDTRVAEFGGLSQLGSGLRMPGRDVGQLGAVESRRGISFGAYSCPVEDCLHPGEGAKTDDGSDGNVRLATVYIVPKRPGVLEIKLDRTKFVDASGNPVRVAGGARKLNVRVGRSSAGSSHPAPGAPLMKERESPRPGPPDLTIDGGVSHADAMEAAIVWTLLREDGAACGAALEDSSYGVDPVGYPSRDVNRDGCVDVTDVQAVVANYGAGNTSDAQLGPENVEAGLNVMVAILSSLVDWMAPRPALAQEVSTFTVDSEGDGTDAQAGDGVCATGAGACTLRAAIQEANLHPGPDTIVFNIPGTGVRTIQLSSQLPTLSDETGPTTIDGYTQPGSTPNTDPLISNATIGVQIAGEGDGKFGGLYVTSPGNLIRGLAFFKLKNALRLYGEGAHDNVIAGNFVGTDSPVTTPPPRRSTVVTVSSYCRARRTTASAALPRRSATSSRATR